MPIFALFKAPLNGVWRAEVGVRGVQAKAYSSPSAGGGFHPLLVSDFLPQENCLGA